jgi:hypothetical protein
MAGPHGPAGILPWTGARQPGRSTKEARSACFTEVGDRGGWRPIRDSVHGPPATAGATLARATAPATTDIAAAGSPGRGGTGPPGMTGVRPVPWRGQEVFAEGEGAPNTPLAGRAGMGRGAGVTPAGWPAPGPAADPARWGSTPPAGPMAAVAAPAAVSRTFATVGSVVTLPADAVSRATTGRSACGTSARTVSRTGPTGGVFPSSTPASCDGTETRPAAWAVVARPARAITTAAAPAATSTGMGTDVNPKRSRSQRKPAVMA